MLNSVRVRIEILPGAFLVRELMIGKDIAIIRIGKVKSEMASQVPF